MKVVDLDVALRARINRMADEHLAMQEALPGVPAAELPAFLKQLEEHAAKLSRLASRLYEPPRGEPPEAP